MSSNGTSDSTAPNSSGCWIMHDGGQQAAVAAAANGELLRARDAAADQRTGDGDEVVEGDLAFLTLRRAMPVRPELAAAANVRDREQAALSSHAMPVVAS